MGPPHCRMALLGWEHEDLKIWIHLFEEKKKKLKRNTIIAFPKAAQINYLFWIEIFHKNTEYYYYFPAYGKPISHHVGKIKTQLNRSFWFSADEKGKILNQSNQTCLGGKISLSVSIWLRNEPSCMTGSGHNACRDKNKINFQSDHEALNIVMVWICGL